VGSKGLCNDVYWCSGDVIIAQWAELCVARCMSRGDPGPAYSTVTRLKSVSLTPLNEISTINANAIIITIFTINGG